MYTGRTIAHYRVEEKLGRGGMGVVHKAVDTKLERTVALKFLSRELSDNEDAKQRFVREAKSASALDHANICTIHDIAETDDGELYIVMAYYKGETLKHRLDSEAFSVARATGIATQIARALQRAHENDIIHRDIKPANVMVSDEDEVKLLDFGLAKLTTGLDLTRAGSTVGTAAYMSPEQARGEDVTAATDVWALGVVTYELLAGQKPFGGAYEQAMIYGILNEDPKPLEELRPDAPASLVSAVRKALEKNPEDRFESAGAFLDAVDGIHSDSAREAAVASSTQPSPTRKPLALAAAAAVIVTLAAVALIPKLLPETGPTAAVSGDRYAVMPFSVSGSQEVQYLGEGIVTLISSKLDGAGSIESVDPRAVMALIGERKLDASKPATGTIVARTLGAGRFVTGEVVEGGDRLSITAILRDTDDPDVSVGSASTEGPTDSVLAMIDDLTTDLLAGSISGPEARLQKQATVTAASLPAIKTFLRGEKYLREGRYREAAAAYEEAVALDSSFALAFFRLSLAGDWIDAPDRTLTAEKAVEKSSGLSSRDKELVKTLRDQRIGLRRQAARQYRQYLTQYPDDVEPQTQLAELLFHDNPRRGESVFDSRIHYGRVLELEPTNVIAQVHLARLDALTRDDSLLAKRSDFFRTIDYTPERAIEVDALYAYSVGDTAMQRDVKRRLVDGPWYFYAYAVHGVSKFLHDPHGASELLDTRRDKEDLLQSMIPQLAVMKGQHLAAREFATNERLASGSWDTYNTFTLTSGLVAPEPAELEYLLRRVRATTPTETIATNFLLPHLDYTPAVASFELAWSEAMLLLYLNRTSEAQRIYRRLAADTTRFHGLGTMKSDVVAGLNALILYRLGDSPGALAQLRSMVYDTPHFITWRPFAEQSRARYLHATLEFEMGDIERAKGIYHGFLESWSPFDAVYIPHAYIQLGQIAEQQDRIDDAISYYRQVMYMWRDCDAEVVPERDVIARRIDSLTLDAATDRG